MNWIGYNDGEGCVVIFLNDFGVIYLCKNCILLIVDWGNCMVWVMKLLYLVGWCYDFFLDVFGGKVKLIFNLVIFWW